MTEFLDTAATIANAPPLPRLCPKSRERRRDAQRPNTANTAAIQTNTPASRSLTATTIRIPA